ncbi:xanthine dehydrogenase isoform X2 [Aedes aegypti]|nr:xanthine dehydrogenase isoform X2 [Aedes aegypti]
MNMDKKLILNVSLPPMHADNYAFRSYRIESRAQNGRTFVVGAFFIRWCARQRTIESAAVCFGGISPTFTHAIETEKTLCGKNPFSNNVLQQVLHALELDLKPFRDPSQIDPEYRKQAAIGIFYKFMLDIAPKKLVDPKFLTGSTNLERPLSNGTQSYKTFPQNWPVTKSITKFDAVLQTSGRASYINDTPTMAHELFAAFVVATKPRTVIKEVDVTEATKLPGVVQFLSAGNIPGNNNFMPYAGNSKHFFSYGKEEEEIFCTEKVLYHGQPVGLILAESFELANRASKLVRIEYSEPDGPVLPTFKHVHQNSSANRIQPAGVPQSGRNYESISGGYYRVSGQVSFEGQYHYTLETQSCICVPKEDGMDVYCATQDADHTLATIAGVLKLPQSKINVICRRVEGSFGSKITRSSHVAGACALAAYMTQRPVRFRLSLESNMTCFGKRKGSVSSYEVSVRGDGKIARLTNTLIYDCGAHISEPSVPLYIKCFSNGYDDSAWKIIPNKARTDSPTNIWGHSSGTADAVATIETIMEHIAFERGLDVLDVRMINFARDSKLRLLLPQFRKDIEFDKRKKEIELFNESNRWKKRGLSIVPVAFPVEYIGGTKAWISVHHLDGSVSITHGGMDIGQGLDTKVAQIAAHTLGVPLGKISIKPCNTLVSANSFMATGNSSSDQVGLAVMKACEILINRMRPIRDANPTASWEVLVSTCFISNVNLTASYWSTESDVEAHKIWALGCSEVELDVLTGNVRVVRADIVEDVGESQNPSMDIGQIEGAFVMGLGYYLNESLQYDPQTGALLTNNTFTYKPPGPKDIPTDFRVKLYQNSKHNPAEALRSKPTGEPAFSVAVSVLFALRQALMSARKDANLRTEWIQLGQPSNAENILHLAGNSTDQYTYYKCSVDNKPNTIL